MRRLLIAVAAAAALLVSTATIVSAEGMTEVIHVTTGEGAVLDVVHRGEPNSMGAPPAVIVDGENVNGG